MTMVYRELTVEDVPKAVLLFRGLAEEQAEVSFAEILSEDEIKKWIIDDNIFAYGAFQGENLLAVLRAVRGRDNRNHAVYLTAAVDKNYRGYKIAKEITLYSLERLKEKGVKIARTYVYSNNRASINTVLSCGFTFAGCVYQHHYDEETKSYIDDLIFHKILS
ncbi:GNAT family N-acetyltransferase [Thermotalea metallivorans]|uniref:N-acetyltransferase domain-containing protein n=1 Tax=Thermotalea metallivorans TaxID=520762 RepID=A0A140L1J2_9FIRM|nr:GNAT family N-acetyltransferase [Thermotalea metallivorans]KXG74417.1 hypothetical protein AN619_24000 [Thermotalea metallivorans]